MEPPPDNDAVLPAEVVGAVLEAEIAGLRARLLKVQRRTLAAEVAAKLERPPNGVQAVLIGSVKTPITSTMDCLHH